MVVRGIAADVHPNCTESVCGQKNTRYSCGKTAQGRM